MSQRPENPGQGRQEVVPAQLLGLQREDETIEPLLLDKGLILQKRRGYRFSIDALLLASLVVRSRAPARRSGKIRYMDLGSGCGIIPILLAKWNPNLQGHGVEIQEPLADLGERNMQLHGLEGRIQVLCMDLKRLPERFPSASLDWITCNPPYRQLRAGKVNPDPQKAMARHEITASLQDICSVTSYLLRTKGRAFLIYPASRSVELLSRLRNACLEPKYLRPVYPRVGEQARWVLVEAVSRGKEGLVMDEPLFVEDEQGSYSTEIRSIFRWDF